VAEMPEDGSKPRARVIRLLAVAGTSCVAGAATTFFLLITYVIGKLYLSGHSIEPKWYDTAGSFVVFGGGLAVAIGMFVVGMRALGGRST
jgi:hypothetical protein